MNSTRYFLVFVLYIVSQISMPLYADKAPSVTPAQAEPANYVEPNPSDSSWKRGSCLKACLADGSDDYLCAENCIVVTKK